MEKTTEIEMGSIYDVNKQLVEQYEKELTKEEIEKKKEIINSFIMQYTYTNNYYMLLCREQNDYTLFVYKGNKIRKDFSKDLINCLIDECLYNRGIIKGIELTEDNQAIEIWLSIEGESYCYYLFPYDNGVIEL